MENVLPLSAWMPITRKEVESRGWDELDVIIVSGDAYIDHPSFGAAVIGRVLEHEGFKVALVPQPNWKDDCRDFKKMGVPRLFFGVSAGSMDSMVNHYTARRRKRSNDAYTPGGEAGFRPDYPSLVYTRLLKQFFPNVPVVLGGIEASLRRITHYDYWQNKLLPSFLVESGADLLMYGMGELPIIELAHAVKNHIEQGLTAKEAVKNCFNIPQISFVSDQAPDVWAKKDSSTIVLNSHEDCLKSKKCQAENFAKIEIASNSIVCGVIVQTYKDSTIVINPPYPISENHSIDMAFDLPYTRLPHPKYKSRGEIPAYTMIRHSVNIHRGCFGGCAFCTISAHQGKQVQSRSEKSILKEIEQITAMPDFKGYLSDLGGPSANMYAMSGINRVLCLNCSRPSCIFPSICKNLNHDLKPLLNLFRKVSSDPKIKKCFIGSGIRYDLLVPFLRTNEFSAADYAREIIKNGVSGRLKVAPEHTEPHVLKVMRKMSFDQFLDFKGFFDSVCRKENLPQQLIPYFISAHPGCNLQDMRGLSSKTKSLGYKLEQVQLFTPTPMTLATEMFYTGLDPYTLEKVFVEKDDHKRDEQNSCFF